MTGTRRISVLVLLPPRVLLLDVAGPIEVLRIANRVQDKVAFDVSFAAPTPLVGCSLGLSLTGAGPLPDRLDAGTMVLICGSAAVPFGTVPDAAADGNAEDAIVAWLRQAIRPGITLISICEGALLAARAGLLDGYACTTHHACCERLAAQAPAARVLENRLFVEDRDRLSSDGITAGIDLMLHLVAGLADSAAALAVARALVVYLRRGPDDPQLSAWLEGRNHLHPAVHRAQDAVAADPAREWSLAALAREAHLSPRHLSRLFPVARRHDRHGCGHPRTRRPGARSAVADAPRHGERGGTRRIWFGAPYAAGVAALLSGAAIGASAGVMRRGNVQICSGAAAAFSRI